MAREFDGSEYLTVDAAPSGVSDWPVTTHGWYYNNTGVTGGGALLQVADKDVPDHYYATGYSGSTDKETSLMRSGGFVTAHSDGVVAVGDDEWTTLNIRFRADTSRVGYIKADGELTTIASQGYPSNLDQVSIGRYGDSSQDTYADGRLAHCAIWSADIGALMLGPLYRGVNPFVMRNDVLVFYAPLHGHESPEPEYAQQNNLTLTGTLKAATNPNVELLENFF